MKERNPLLKESLIDTLDTLLIVLMALKVYGLISTEWVYVFAPLYLMIVIIVVPTLYTRACKEKKDAKKKKE